MTIGSPFRPENDFSSVWVRVTAAFPLIFSATHPLTHYRRDGCLPLGDTREGHAATFAHVTAIGEISVCVHVVLLCHVFPRFSVSRMTSSFLFFPPRETTGCQKAGFLQRRIHAVLACDGLYVLLDAERLTRRLSYPVLLVCPSPDATVVAQPQDLFFTSCHTHL